MRLLLAEDETELANALAAILKHNNYSVDVVLNGRDALDFLSAENYDAAILDIMMPHVSGIEVLKQIRTDNNPIPVLLLTAKSETEDKVLGLDCGADDYLTKPFATKELLARIRALTRRQATTLSDTILSLGNISLNRATFMLRSPYGAFQLANKEFQILELLLTNQTTFLSTERLMEKIWGYDSDAELNVVWVYISYLRKKLSAIQSNIQIKATRNAGYSLEVIS
ncbi:MAG: response regulator transcription factor [Evtepia sp.]